MWVFLCCCFSGVEIYFIYKFFLNLFLIKSPVVNRSKFAISVGIQVGRICSLSVLGVVMGQNIRKI